MVKTEHLIFECKWKCDPNCSLWTACLDNIAPNPLHHNVDMYIPFQYKMKMEHVRQGQGESESVNKWHEWIA